DLGALRHDDGAGNTAVTFASNGAADTGRCPKSGHGSLPQIPITNPGASGRTPPAVRMTNCWRCLVPASDGIKGPARPPFRGPVGFAGWSRVFLRYNMIPIFGKKFQKIPRYCTDVTQKWKIANCCKPLLGDAALGDRLQAARIPISAAG